MVSQWPTARFCRSEDCGRKQLLFVAVGGSSARPVRTVSNLGAQVTLIDAGREAAGHRGGRGHHLPVVRPASDEARRALACAAAREYPALVGELAELRREPGTRSNPRVGALLLPGPRELAEAGARAAGLQPARGADAPEMGSVPGLLSGAEALRAVPAAGGRFPAAVHIGGRGPGGRAAASRRR